MKEAIIRITSSSEDAEMAIKTNNDVIFKNISLDRLREIIDRHVQNKDVIDKPKLLNEQVIGFNHSSVLIKQNKCKKIVTLSTDSKMKAKVYKVNFPNALYIMSFYNNQIKNIKAFAFKEYRGKDTELFEYPMPNEFSGNTICLGSAKREIEDDDYVAALERVIATTYTHSSFSGIRGFTSSKKWFEYLSKNPFPDKFLKPLNYTLEKEVY